MLKSDAGIEISVMTFNLRVNTIMDGHNRWAKRVDSVVATITAHDPAVLGVQECLSGMLRDLKSRLPAYRDVGKGNKPGGKGERCAILYNRHILELLNWGQFWLSHTPEQPSKAWKSSQERVAVWAHFQVGDADRTEFLVLNTHLDHVSQSAREQGSKLIWQKLNRIVSGQSIPVLVMGDFNEKPDSRVVRFWHGTDSIDGLSANLVDTEGNQALQTGTFHGFHGGKSNERIDYIFVSPQVKIKSAGVETRKFSGRYPSDHYPVTAIVGFSEEGSK